MTDVPSLPHLDVLSAGAMRPILEELFGMFERQTGTPAAVRFSTSGAVKDRILNGEATDVVVSTQAAIAELARHQKILTDTAIAVARSAIGVAVRSGAAKPAIDSVESFKQALRDAQSIALADPATGSPSANHVMPLFERLGLMAELGSKIKLVGHAGHVVSVGKIVADGMAEIGIQQVAELLEVPGVDLVGELPAPLQHITVFAAAVAATAANAGAARNLVDFIAAPTAAAIISAKGMSPAR
jgi:molybdate transport system substrate-binding protein